MLNPINFVHLKISIVGGGYVGLVSAVCFAELGYSVVIIEKDPQKVKSINDGIPPIYETGLETYLKSNVKKNLTASASYHEILNTDITIICVGTPDREDGSANLDYISQASESIGDILQDKGTNHLILVKSTVPPGTTQNLVIPITRSASKNNKNLSFGVNPEFLREGRAIEDFFHPDRIVIGCNDRGTENILNTLYSPLKAPIIITSIMEAEMIKYASNAFLATKISFSNEIGNICKKLNLDVNNVMRGVGLDHRISPYFLNAGVGFGGSCFPKDVKSLIKLAECHGEDPILLKSVMRVNALQPIKIIELLEKRTGSLQNKRIAVLGLAFKDNTDDVRESRALVVIQALLKQGSRVTAYDPVAINAAKKIIPDIEYYRSAADALRNADAALIMTEWPEFQYLNSEFDLMKSKIIIEGRRILSYEGIEGICW